jgi:hypothetical protein
LELHFIEPLLLHFSCQTNVLHGESFFFYKASFYHRSFELEFSLKTGLLATGLIPLTNQKLSQMNQKLTHNKRSTFTSKFTTTVPDILPVVSST